MTRTLLAYNTLVAQKLTLTVTVSVKGAGGLIVSAVMAWATADEVLVCNRDHLALLSAAAATAHNASAT